MRNLAAVLAVALLVFSASTASAEDVIEHDSFDSLLETYVDSEGQIAYEKWKESDEDLKELKSYLESVAEAEPKGHSSDARLAFYINAYNATVIASIINHWPTDSPMSVKGFFKVEKHDIAGKEMTLDKLEHGLIRKKFDEARIHFVLVCAAKSCPRLRQKALTEENLDSVLAAAAEEFIPAATSLDDGKVVTSKLFKWFAKDFEEAEGSVREYLASYTDGDVKEALGKEDVTIDFSEYDWKVNKQ